MCDLQVLEVAPSCTYIARVSVDMLLYTYDYNGRLNL